MRSDLIIFKLKEMGYFQSVIAEELEVTVGAVNSVLHKRSKSKMIMQYIADVLCHSYDDLWGDCPEEERKKRSLLIFRYEKEIRSLKKRIIELENGA